MTKTATAKTKAKTKAATNGNAARVEWPADMLKSVKDLKPSPTNPRQRFPADSITELAGSIRDQGVIEPLIIRASGQGFEIVCGERRWRAAKEAGETAVPCHVRELTDNQVLDIQIHENLHREDVHPMDEAYGYKVVQDKLGCDIKELAARVGKPERYVLGRLKLNQLIKEAQKDIEAGHLPLTYALEIAKYGPDSQKRILNEAAYEVDSQWTNKGYVYTPRKNQLRPFDAFKRFINEKVLLLLSAAPFDLKATDLRDDGLPCVKCPERTGANASLFDAEYVGKKDSCLNAGCYRSKANRLVQITRETIAAKTKIAADAVPRIDTSSWENKDGVIGRDKFIVVGKKPYSGFYSTISAKTCKNQVETVDVASANFGKVVTVCLKSSGCKTHFKNQSASSAKSSKSDEQLAADNLAASRRRREEIFNAKVAEDVRRRVIVEASKVFAPKFSVKTHVAGFLPELVKRLHDLGNVDGMVDTLCQMAKIKRSSDKPIERAQVLFFYLNCSKGEIGYGNSYRSQGSIKTIATDYRVNYKLIDAEVRLAMAPKKHQAAHKIYFDAIAAGKDAKQPRLYSEKWQRND